MLCVPLESVKAQVVGAQVVEEGTPNDSLVANPKADLFTLAETLYAQAQVSGQNAEEKQRLLSLAARKYADYVSKFSGEIYTPLALYKQGLCFFELGQQEYAYPLWERLVQTYKKGSTVALAAYRLATLANGQKNYSLALDFYKIALNETDKPELAYDSRYRMAKVYMALNQKAEAASTFSAMIQDARTPAMFKQASRIALAGLDTEANRLESALALYEAVLADSSGDKNTMVSVLFQAALVAEKLGQVAKAEKFYATILGRPEWDKWAPRAQVSLMALYYKQKQYAQVLREMKKRPLAIEKDLEFKRALLAGNAAFSLKRYTDAILYFSTVESLAPLSESSLQSAYKRLLCSQELKLPNFEQSVEGFLQTYESRFPQNAYVHLVRVMLADMLTEKDPARSAALFERVDTSKLPEEVRRDILYKRAWSLAAAKNAPAALRALEEFISQYPSDRFFADALVLRGQMYKLNGDEVGAMSDFNRAIREFPKNNVTATAWQSAAQLYAQKQDTAKMIEYYEGLIKNFPKVKPSTVGEAHYEMGKGYFGLKKYEKAVTHLKEAMAIFPQRYKDQSELLLVVSYYQLLDAQNLREVYDRLYNENRTAAASLPDSIPSWLGTQCYAKQDYAGTDKYLTLAANVQEPDRTKKAIWATLAKARFYLGKFERALNAVDFYLASESEPARRAQGLLDKSAILAGQKEWEKARLVAEEALATGIEGPIKASLNICLGDIAYAEGDFEKAARLYGTTSQLFTSDKMLKPQALYKAALSLEKMGKTAEAQTFQTELKKEFPQWKPAPTILTPGY